LKNRKIRLGKYAIPAVLLLIIGITAVSAVAYVILQWTTTATVQANPKVCFFEWAVPNTKLNSFDYPVNIFPSVKTVDENITHGVWNWDSSSHTTYMRIVSITNNATNIDLITTYLKYGNGTTIITITWTTGGPTSWQQFTADATTRFTIWTEITAKSGASGSSVITYDLKVENP